jgi:hypothetical protein
MQLLRFSIYDAIFALKLCFTQRVVLRKLNSRFTCCFLCFIKNADEQQHLKQ